MTTHRKTAITVGLLYIIGTVTGILSVIFYGPILNAQGSFAEVSAHEDQIVIGALLTLSMGLALAMVPVTLFPILKKQNEALALGYVVFRGGLETVSYIALVISRLFLLVLGQEYASAGASDASYSQALGASVLAAYDYSINPIVIIVFSLGALMLYTLFYQSNLIPRWISGWGVFAILLHLTTGFLTVFRLTNPLSTVIIVMNLPILFQEMVMAVWLIVKGFNQYAATTGAAS